MEAISKYKPGANITILNTSYKYPMRDEDGNPYPDYITLVYKDVDTGEKGHVTIYKPKYTYYMIKDEYVKPYPQFFIEKDKVTPVTVQYSNVIKSIAQRVGKENYFYDNIRCGQTKLNRMFHFEPAVMSSDIGIEAFYRMEFDRTYKNDVCPINKAYFDIETDINYINNRFPEPGECPINAISLFIEKTNTHYEFLLKDKRNPKSVEFEDYVSSNNFIDEFKSFLTDNVGGWKNLHRFHLQDTKFQISFFDDELEMIVACFKLINYIQPDFILAWNMAFDIPFVIERLIYFGVNPADVMCHPDFEEQEANYYVDTRHINEKAERTDFATISSYSVYLDQMIQFASRRKGQSAFTTFALDAIGDVVAGVRKLDYHHITDNIGDLPYLDYKTFVMYSMMDTLVQKCIEEKTNDIDYVFSKAILNSTEYGRVHRQTVYLANRAAMFFWDKGFIIGNNVNKLNENGEKYEGAYVADPVLLSDTPKVKLNHADGTQTAINVCKNAGDYDYKALYPSETMENNIAPNTQIGKIIMPDKIYVDENIRDNKKFDRSGDFVEHFASRNWLQIGKRYLNLGTYEEVLDDIMEYFYTITNPMEFIGNKNGMEEICRRILPNNRIVFKTEEMINPVKKLVNFNDVKDKAKKMVEGIEVL